MTTRTLRNHARLMMWLVTLPLAGLGLLAALLIGHLILNGGFAIEFVAIYYFPMALYIWAIWMIRVALKAIARGELFGAVVPRLTFRIGAALFGGALFTVFGVPILTAAIEGQPWLKTFEPSGVVLGVIGAALMVFARLFAQASAMRDELDGFV